MSRILWNIFCKIGISNKKTSSWKSKERRKIENICFIFCRENCSCIVYTGWQRMDLKKYKSYLKIFQSVLMMKCRKYVKYATKWRVYTFLENIRVKLILKLFSFSEFQVSNLRRFSIHCTYSISHSKLILFDKIFFTIIISLFSVPLMFGIAFYL